MQTANIQELLLIEASKTMKDTSSNPAEPQLSTMSLDFLLMATIPAVCLTWLMCSTPAQRRRLVTLPRRAVDFIRRHISSRAKAPQAAPDEHAQPHTPPNPEAKPPNPAPEDTTPTSAPTSTPAPPVTEPKAEELPPPVLLPQPLPVPAPTPPTPELLPLRVVPAAAQESPECHLTAADLDSMVDSLPQEILQAPTECAEIAEKFCAWLRKGKPFSGLMPEEEEKDDYWFIGDLHGYLSALQKILAYIHRHARPGRRQNIIFLGDLIDRGPQSWEVVATVQQLMMMQNESLRVLFIRGNHDTCFECRADNTYTSGVSPCESVPQLQKMAQTAPQKADAVARTFCEMVDRAPCMAELPIGNDRVLLITHGGVPHVDLQEKLRTIPTAPQGTPLLQAVPEDLSEAVAKDFTWVRFSPNLPRKKPNRGNSGCEIGYTDVNQYRSLHEQLTGRRIAGIIRGHDHEEAGFRLVSYDPELNPRGRQKECFVLTVNALEPSLGSGGLFRKCDIALLHHSRQGGLTLHILPTHHLC